MCPHHIKIHVRQQTHTNGPKHNHQLAQSGYRLPAFGETQLEYGSEAIPCELCAFDDYLRLRQTFGYKFFE